ncbi:hypothetical protein [Cupriavidus alkaliphilus]|uniref:hypothetical protein n=1 Tax=Cupriavidus alkaliphilus TaxID=942866 RepID=UPI0016145D15|nr:hypothetical protein [Cupriavidus alkaliphilus]MBB3012047.1 hypothetical protein [Cupriavidus alkaliphilus]
MLPKLAGALGHHPVKRLTTQDLITFARDRKVAGAGVIPSAWMNRSTEHTWICRVVFDLPCRQGGNVIASLCLAIVKRRIDAVKVVGAVNEIVGMYAVQIASDGPAIRTSDRVAYYVVKRACQPGGT